MERARSRRKRAKRRCDFDFVLWKMSKDGEPCWSSPWGMGRPGWHIECSAMCSDILGQSVDINGGGIDLNFPHHENQLAQSEAHYDTEQWVNFFIHTGHLHIDGLKMSKSLKNFITIRAALKMYSARQIRFLFLLNQWCDPMELTPVAAPDGSGVVGFKQMDLALSIERLFVEFFHSIKGVFRTSGSYHVDKQQTWHERERDLVIARHVSSRRARSSHRQYQHPQHPSCVARSRQGDEQVPGGDEDGADVRRSLLLERVGKYVTKILKLLGRVLGHRRKSGSRSLRRVRPKVVKKRFHRFLI